MLHRPRRRARLRPAGRLPFAVVLGLSDGILNALTLASATVLHGTGLSLNLAARVGVVALATAVATVFIAEYAQYRSELAQAERQLMYTRSGRLAATSLGKAVLRDAGVASTAAGAASFTGATLPLAVGASLPSATWIALPVSVACLGGLGAFLPTFAGGRRWVWSTALVVAGIAVCLIGVKVDLV